jgi:signal transduction histidine kinase
MKAESKIGVQENEIPESLKIVIFRIVQEAMNNVARHSRAEHVQVILRKRKARIELLIKDDGVGVDDDSVSLSSSCRRGFGLASMKERTELSGGEFHLDAEPGLGTSITASWPFKAPTPCR